MTTAETRTSQAPKSVIAFWGAQVRCASFQSGKLPGFCVCDVTVRASRFELVH